MVGFGAGIAVDALVPSSFGAAALSFTAVAFIASRVKAVFFADHVALTALFVFVGKLLFDALNTPLAASHEDPTWWCNCCFGLRCPLR